MTAALSQKEPLPTFHRKPGRQRNTVKETTDTQLANDILLQQWEDKGKKGGKENAVVGDLFYLGRLRDAAPDAMDGSPFRPSTLKGFVHEHDSTSEDTKKFLFILTAMMILWLCRKT